MTSVRSPPSPRVPVSRARSAVSGVSAAAPPGRSPRGGRRPASRRRVRCGSRSSPDLCCQTVNVEHEGSRDGAELDLLSGGPRGAAAGRIDDRPAGCGHPPRAAAGHPRGRRNRQDPGDREPLSVAGRAGARPERLGLLTPTAGRAPAAARAAGDARSSSPTRSCTSLTPPQLAGLILRRAGAGADPLATALSAGDRLAMLVDRIDELSLQHHDFGGRPNALLAGFVRRIDRLKAELVTPEEYSRWAAALAAGSPEAALEREFAEIYAHPRADAGRDRRPRRGRPDRRRDLAGPPAARPGPALSPTC